MKGSSVSSRCVTVVVGSAYHRRRCGVQRRRREFVVLHHALLAAAGSAPTRPPTPPTTPASTFAASLRPPPCGSAAAAPHRRAAAVRRIGRLERQVRHLEGRQNLQVVRRSGPRSCSPRPRAAPAHWVGGRRARRRRRAAPWSAAKFCPWNAVWTRATRPASGLALRSACAAASGRGSRSVASVRRIRFAQRTEDRRGRSESDGQLELDTERPPVRVTEYQCHESRLSLTRRPLRHGSVVRRRRDGRGDSSLPSDWHHTPAGRPGGAVAQSQASNLNVEGY